MALSTGLVVVTGRSPGSHSPPLDLYRRMGADLARTHVQVVADLHGPELNAILEQGAIRFCSRLATEISAPIAWDRQVAVKVLDVGVQRSECT